MRKATVAIVSDVSRQADGWHINIRYTIYRAGEAAEQGTGGKGPFVSARAAYDELARRHEHIKTELLAKHGGQVSA